jgi:ABC-type glycerol-3-phosphate transport system permease component
MTRRAVRPWQGNILAGLSYAGLIAVALVFLFPFFWMVSNAIRSNDEVLAVPPRLLPTEYHWENFIEAWPTCRSAASSSTRCSSPPA